MASGFEAPPKELDERISKDQAFLLADILMLYRNAYDFAVPFFDEAEELTYAYDAWVDPNSHIYKYNPSIPLVFSLSEDMAATIVNAFFERERIIDVNPTEGISHGFSDERIARQLQVALNLMMLHPDTNLINEVLDFIKQGAMYGNTYSTTLPRMKRKDGDLQYLGPKIRPQSYFHILGDPAARRLGEGRFIMQIEHVSFKELQRREKNERYFNTIQVKNDRWIGDDRLDEIFTTIGRLSKHLQLQSEKENGPIHLLHVYLLGHNTDDKHAGHIITVANGRVIVRDTRKSIDFGDMGRHVVKPYPYPVFDEFVFYPKPLERYGKGIGHIVAKVQDEINLFKRMRLEAIELTLKPVILADLGFDIPIDMLVATPGAIWDVPKNAIDLFTFQDNTTASYTEQAWNLQQAKQLSGAPEVSGGERSPRRTQATTELMLDRNARKKSTTIMKRFELWVQSVVLKTVTQMHLWMDQGQYERIIGEEDAGFFALATEDVMRLFDFNVTSTSLSATREIEKATFVQYAQFVAQFPETKRRELLRDAAQLFLPTRNPDRYVYTIEELQQMQQPQGQGTVPGAGTERPEDTGQPTIPPEQIQQGNLLQ